MNGSKCGPAYYFVFIYVLTILQAVLRVLGIIRESYSDGS